MTATIDHLTRYELDDALLPAVVPHELAPDEERRELLGEVISQQLDELLSDTYRDRLRGFTQHVGRTTHEFDMVAMRREDGGPVEELVTRHQVYGPNARVRTGYEVEVFTEGRVGLRVNIDDTGEAYLSEYDAAGKRYTVYDPATIDTVLFELGHRISDAHSRVELRSPEEREAADKDAEAKLIALVPRVAWRGTRTE